MQKDTIIIYTDGSALGNPGPGGWGALVVFPDDRAVELGGGDSHTTNNKMELRAALEALQKVGDSTDKIILYTDSAYVVNGITKWVFGWQKNNWIKATTKEPVLNRELWEDLIFEVKGKKITWEKIPGHSGMAGNERADAIATTFAAKETPDLYDGTYADFHIDVSDTTWDVEKQKARSAARARSKMPAYSYVSLVGGKFKSHKTWKECEARVKGKKGVQYKKALSVEDEKAIRTSWGV